MAVFEITAPDGRVFEVEGPEGSTAEQALAQVQAQYAPKTLPVGAETAMNLGRGLITGGPIGLIAAGAKGAAEGLDTVTGKAGGAVTDAAAKVAPPEVAAGLGTATQILPTLLIGGGAAKAGAPVMDSAAKRLMQSALKPDSKARVSGDAAAAIQTMLDEGITMSQGGAAKMRSLIDNLSKQVTQEIAASPATVNKGYVASEVYKTLQRFTNQVNNRADRAAILKSWKEFNEDFANLLPVADAQKLKQGTYSILADKYAKGGLPAIENEASIQAQMAQARGLRLGIEDAVPKVAPLNERQSKLINALELTEGRAGTAANRDIGGIAWIAQNPIAAAGMLADRSPAFKSLLARFIYEFKEGAPAMAGTAAAASYQTDPKRQ